MKNQKKNQLKVKVVQKVKVVMTMIQMNIPKINIQ